jgi:hypothetical protein
LVKIGAKIVRHGRPVVFRMAEVAVPRALFQEILNAIAALRPSSSALMLRITVSAGRRVYWRETRAQIRGCRSETPLLGHRRTAAERSPGCGPKNPCREA